MGWDTDIKVLPNNYKPFIGCLSHTSKWELMLYYLYKDYDFFKRSVIVMAPQYLKMLGKFADKIDCIPSTRLEIY